MSTVNLEEEAKLRASDDFSLARLPRELDGYVAAPAEFHRLHTIYYDSEDLRLTRWDCSLRYRVNECWTLKVLQFDPEDAKVFVRKEYSFDGGANRVPPEAVDLAFEYLRGAPVAPVAELRTLRTKRAIRAGDAGDPVADVVDDDVHVIKGGETDQHFRQIEIESLNGDLQAIATLRSLLRRAGAGRTDTQAKNQRILPGGVDPELPKRRIGKTSTGVEIFTAAFAAAVERVVRSGAALRAEADAEVLHEMRTAVRRLRSYLRSFRPLLDRRWAEGLRGRLGWINRLMAKARNLDVLIVLLEAGARELEPSDAARSGKLLERLHGERDRAYKTMCAGLREPRYAALLDEVICAARAPVARARSKSASRKQRDGVVSKARSRLCRAERKAASPPAERDLHAIRIRAKHLRFAAEALEPAGKKRLGEIARRAKKLQTILGDHHDAIVAVRHLRETAQDGQLAFAAGQLTERSRSLATKQRSRWRRAFRRATALRP
ncbi:MAG: CHAD domain-containing protein [Candidatus Eremiobacteraeota bacterium]|nr:CHAD domain-containing protein [Candidatus Eremiobacteraeota bacterium]